jgi:hypothetical protein
LAKHDEKTVEMAKNILMEVLKYVKQ